MLSPRVVTGVTGVALLGRKNKQIIVNPRILDDKLTSPSDVTIAIPLYERTQFSSSLTIYVFLINQTMTVQQQRRFLSILIMLLSLTSTIAFSSVGGPALATKTSMKTTTTSLHAWGVPSVPTSVWAIEAHPTARRIEYYDE